MGSNPRGPLAGIPCIAEDMIHWRLALIVRTCGGLLLGAGFLVLDSPLRAQDPTAVHGIFRHIVVGVADTIGLGSLFGGGVLWEKVNDSTYQLRSQEISGAERIRVYVDSDRRLNTMEFQYGPGTRFATLLASYLASLGPTTGVDSTSERRHAIWVDRDTKFEIVSWMIGGKEFVSSRMTDLDRASLER